MSEVIQEDGPWNVFASGDEHRVGVSSDDFKHDVTLWISGDFVNRGQKLDYAAEIVKRLNTWKGEKHD